MRIKHLLSLCSSNRFMRRNGLQALVPSAHLTHAAILVLALTFPIHSWAAAGYKDRPVSPGDLIRPQSVEVRFAPAIAGGANLLAAYSGTVLLNPPISTGDGGEIGQTD